MFFYLSSSYHFAEISGFKFLKVLRIAKFDTPSSSTSASFLKSLIVCILFRALKYFGHLNCQQYLHTLHRGNRVISRPTRLNRRQGHLPSEPVGHAVRVIYRITAFVVLTLACQSFGEVNMVLDNRFHGKFMN